MACSDAFSIRMAAGAVNASITIPGGSAPIVLDAASDYIIGFIYVTGLPAATAFDIEWTAILDDNQVSLDRPSSVFEPTAPEGEGRVVRTALVRGALPETVGITYNGIVWIRQE